MSAAPRASHFVAAPFAAVRAPTLPMNTASGLSHALVAPDTDDALLAAVLPADRATVHQRLRELLGDPFVREALWLASPSLDEAIDTWLRDPAHPRAHDVPATALRYLTRMATRSTPFGLFASHTVATAAASTVLTAPSPSVARRRVRLDMQYLCALVAALERDPDLRARLRFEACNSAYVSGAQLRYAEGRVDPATRERHNDTVSVEHTSAVQRALLAARDGATLDVLCDALVAAEGVDAADASAFVDELVEAGLLVSELSPGLTGGDPLDTLLRALTRAAPEHPATTTLREVRARLDAPSSASTTDARARYLSIAEALRALPCPVEIGRLFQVDLHGPDRSSIGADVPREVERVVTTLASITPCSEDADLVRLRDRFVARWEDATVPLTVALDEERGLGFGEAQLGGLHPLLDGVALRGADSEETQRFGARERWMQSRVHEALSSGRKTWELDARDLERLHAESSLPMPDCFAAMCTLLGDADDATMHFEMASGPSGARLLGRFTQSDERLAAFVREHLRAEEALYSDAIVAELVHLPQGRLGNIAARATLREWEIPYLCRAGVPSERQITLDDLLLRVDASGRFRMSSRRLGREVIPRMTNAHNHLAAELPFYRFLCALAGQGVRPGVAWSWGALASAPFLPRVTLGRTIVSLATWNLDLAELSPLAKRDETGRLLGLRALRRRLGLPREVTVRDGDNVLPLDLENPVAVDSFFELLRGRSGAVAVRESLVTPERCVASSPDGAHAHELVIPFVRRDARPSAPAANATHAPRSYAPGSEWLYLKVYTGSLTADAVLAGVIAPVVRAFREKQALTRWFFVRYGDPDHHLRLRFKGDPAVLLGELLPALHRALARWIEDGRVARFTVETYVPEIARYGGDKAMAHCEAVFEADSDATLAMLDALDGDASAGLRWRAGARALHDLFEAFGLDPAERSRLLDSQRAAWGHRMGATRETTTHVSRIFREERRTLEALVGSAQDDDLILAPWASRATAIAAPARAIRALAEAGRLGAPRDALLASLAHMTINRAMGDAQNAYEVVLYELLAKLYRSQVARRTSVAQIPGVRRAVRLRASTC